MSRKKLTDLFVEGVKPPKSGRLEFFDTTFPSLALRVTANGRKSWSLFYRVAGHQRRYTIGPYPAFKPADARKAASGALHRVAAGGDPAEEKRRQNSIDDQTFAGVARRYLRQQVERNSAASTYRETARIMEQDAIPVWGKRPIASIARRDVSALVDAKAASGAEVQANRVLARLRTLFGWAVGKDLIDANPCEGLKPPTKEKARDRVLFDAEIIAFWRAADDLGWPFGPLFQLLLLTAQRRDEVASMEWSEVNLDTGLWSIPREKAKNDHGHDVQLSAEALVIIKALPRVAGPYMFSTNGKTAVSGFSRAKNRLDAAMARHAGGEIAPFILHDVRRSAATHMARLGVAPHVVDRILNHTSGTIRGVARVYNRFDYAGDRRAALERWAAHVGGLISGNSNIIPFSGERDRRRG
jgi:integrase